MAIVPGILQSAQALGINPLDLATAISYETAGTFDPTKRGPTTQWGQHRGLIQFGEPQAREYGVNWEDPVGSQLGADGAVVRYLKKAGVQPGMGLLDIYSAINAGGVGRYGASDANNGGAPGTVRDKVEKQMAGHREKAMALLGGDYTPPPMEQMQGGTQMQGLLGMIGAPDTKRKTYGNLGEAIKASASDGSIWDTVAMGLNTMRGQFADPNITAQAQGRMENRESERVANATAEWLRQNGRDDLANAIEGGMINGAQAFEMMQPQGVDAIEINGQLVDRATGQVVGDYRTPEADKPQSLVNAGDGRVYDPNTEKWIMAPDSGQPDVPDSFRVLEMRAQAAGLQPGSAEYARFMVEGGRADGMAIDVDPATGAVSVRQGAGAGSSAKPFTEGQSKDNVYATRAQGALEKLDPVADALTDRTDRMAETLPLGLGRGVQSDDFQIAKNAGDEFLTAILRKDTGAAITAEEQAIYGSTYLPQPGDRPAVLEQKKVARLRALEALKAGMSPDQIVAQERALDASTPDVVAPPAPDVSDDDLLRKYGG